MHAHGCRIGPSYRGSPEKDTEPLGGLLRGTLLFLALQCPALRLARPGQALPEKQGRSQRLACPSREGCTPILHKGAALRQKLPPPAQWGLGALGKGCPVWKRGEFTPFLK